jgi:hypothetical protein
VSAADRERILLLECRLEQMRSALDEARADADRARQRLAEAAAREVEHARRFSSMHQELADARAEVLELHRRLDHTSALHAELEGRVFESGPTSDVETLVRLRREVAQERQRASGSERILERLRSRVGELLASRETVMSRIAEWQKLVRDEEPEAADLAEFIAELRGEILALEREGTLAAAREASLRERLASLGVDPDAPSGEADGADPGRVDAAAVGADAPHATSASRTEQVLAAPRSEADDGAHVAALEAGAPAAADDEARTAAHEDGVEPATVHAAEQAAQSERAAMDAPAVSAPDPVEAWTPAPPEVEAEDAATRAAAEIPADPDGGQPPSVAEPAEVAAPEPPAAPSPSLQMGFEDALEAAGPRGARGKAKTEVAAASAGPAPAASAELAPAASAEPEPAASEAPTPRATAEPKPTARAESAPAEAPATPRPRERKRPSAEGRPREVHPAAAALAAANTPAARTELLLRLGRGGDAGAVEAIRVWTAAPEFAVRAAAYEALGRLLERDPETLEPFVVDGLADPDARVRRRVVLATASARGLAIRPLLEPLKEDPDPQVRRVAREVLRQAPAAGDVRTDSSARPEAQSARPEAQGARPGAQGARPGAQGARPEAEGTRPEAGFPRFRPAPGRNP